MQKLSRWILRIAGWTIKVTVEEPPKSVICLAPHTSNWDFIIGKLSCWALKRKLSFMIKKSWFVFPLNLIFGAMGGMPIERNKKTATTDQVAERFRQSDSFHIAITPEGTRSLVKKWKMGFYHIAVKANVPIQLAYIDYGKKEVGITEIFIPTGDEKADLKYIRAFYKDVQARFPEKFLR
ncbi:MAG: Acyltransferase [Bacteroidetes bacterium ADurb.Bin174]|nr:MAG: Acyltransferase [Bacteroidetes bacterium ADurb.Bin174]